MNQTHRSRPCHAAETAMAARGNVSVSSAQPSWRENFQMVEGAPVGGVVVFVSVTMPTPYAGTFFCPAIFSGYFPLYFLSESVQFTTVAKKATSYGEHLTRGGLAVRALCIRKRGGLEILARQVRGVRTKKSLSSGTLSLVLRGHRPIDALAEQLARKTGVAIEWFGEPAAAPEEEAQA